MTWDLTIAFALGLVIGSFVTVLVHRLPLMIASDRAGSESAERFDLCAPASHCPHCHTPIRVWHNVPVLSYLWLKGRCSACQHPISPQYPAIEMVTGLLWLACAWRWGLSVQGACWAVFATVLLALSIIDWQTTWLPDDLTQALVWGGLLASAAGGLDLDVRDSIWGAASGYAALWLVATVFERITGKVGMGGGDFKLLAGLGAWLGPLALIPLVLVASISGACVGLALKFQGRLNEDGYIPFGPFLALAGAGLAWMGVPAMA